ANHGPQVNDAPTVAPPPHQGAGSSLVPQVTTGTCSRCGSAAGNCVCAAADDPYPNGMGAMAYPYVYALGRVEMRFPSLAVEKEFAQATGRAETAGLTDQQVVQSVLSQPHNRYLARQLCWLFT